VLGLVIHSNISQPRLPPNLDDARVKDKMEILNLNINIKISESQERRSRNEDEEEQPEKEVQRFPYFVHLAKNLLEKDPNLDFMDPSRRERLTEYYLSDPKVQPGKEVKHLKNSKLDRFADILEINFDLVANAQVKAIEAIEQGQRDIGF
jgi:hypothetical protein